MLVFVLKALKFTEIAFIYFNFLFVFFLPKAESIELQCDMISFYLMFEPNKTNQPGVESFCCSFLSFK